MIDWAAIKTEYITTDTSYRRLSAKYGVSIAQICNVSKSEGWLEQRERHKNNVFTKACRKAEAKEVDRLARIGIAAGKALDVAVGAFEDEQQFNKYLVERREKYAGDIEGPDGELLAERQWVEEQIYTKLDTKALKDLTAVLKDLTGIIRNVYGMPTQAEDAAQKLASERLDIEKQRLELDRARAGGDEDDYETGVVLLPDGDWDTFSGQYFTEFRASPDLKQAEEHGFEADAKKLLAERRFTHVIEPFDLSKGECRGWNIVRSYDFGYARPFSCAWWAIDYDGTMYRIMEMYGCTKNANEGVKWTPEEQFRKISELEQTHPWLRGRDISGVADPAIWDASRGESIADVGMKYGVYFTPGDHERIPGWMQCHYRLQFDDNGYPRCYAFSNCRGFIRTIPLMMYDETHPEDLDSKLEDHIADEWRYMCMSRPIEPQRPVEQRDIISDPLNMFKHKLSKFR